MKRRTIVIIVVSAAVVTIGLAFGAFFAGRAFFHQIKPKPVTENDRKLVVTAARMHEFGGPEPDPELETLTVQRFLGTANVEYEYEVPASAEPEQRIYIQSTVMVSMTAAEAMQQHTLGVLALRTGMAASGDVKVEPAPQLLTFGDQRYASYLSKGGERIGNLIVVRTGRIVHMLIVSGLYFDDPAEIAALMKPSVDEAKRQFARKR